MSASRLAKVHMAGTRSESWLRRWIILAAVVVLAGLLVGGRWLAIATETLLVDRGLSPDAPVMTGMLIGVVCIYIVATALPFVPGAEIGLSLLMLLGAPIAPVVYGATVLALVLAFVVARHVPEPLLVRLLAKVGLHRASSLLGDLPGRSEAERVRQIVRAAPSGWLPWIMRHRFWAIVLLINLPGNTLMGGGGGLAMTVGLSRIMSLPAFTLCVMVAVCPVPLVVLLFGFAAR